MLKIRRIGRLHSKSLPAGWETMHKMYFSVSTAEIVTIAEGTADAMAAAEMVIGSSGTTTGVEVIELIDSKSMTAAMETANKVVSAYQAPNK